jgi:putative ABC transport system ATP-binding protein
MQHLVELHNISKIYRMEDVEVPALKNINLKFDKGETLAIMGPSGCGKSTLLHILGCLDRPTKGKLLIEGKDVSQLGDNDLAKIRGKKIGFVFQFFYLIPTFSALRNVMLPMSFSDSSKTEKENRAKELLKMVGMEKREDHFPSQLSGGERQRVAIARAMINKPGIILADEPTGNLDSKTGNEIMDILLRLNKEEKVTLVLVTHDKYIASHAKKIIYMKDGEIIKESRS